MKKLSLYILLLAAVPLFAHATVDESCPCNTSAGETCNESTGLCELTSTQNTATQNASPAPSSVSNNNGYVPLTSIPGLTDQSQATNSNLSSFLNNLYEILIGLAAVIAVIQIIRGGFEIATTDSIGSHQQGRKHITDALLGLLLVLSPVIVFSIINPSILQFGRACPDGTTTFLCMQALTLPTATTNGASSITTQIDLATQCSVVGQSGYVQTATCPSDAAASQWLATNCLGKTSGPACNTKNSNGCTSSVVSCEYSTKTLTFVNLGSSGITSIFSSFNFQPLNQQTASDFNIFQNGCSTSGGQVCTVNPDNISVRSSDCNYTTSIGVNQSGKCYSLQLYCFSQPDADLANSFLASLNPTNYIKGQFYYSCTPSLKFTPQSIQ